MPYLLVFCMQGNMESYIIQNLQSEGDNFTDSSICNKSQNFLVVSIVHQLSCREEKKVERQVFYEAEENICVLYCNDFPLTDSCYRQGVD